MTTLCLTKFKTLKNNFYIPLLLRKQIPTTAPFFPQRIPPGTLNMFLRLWMIAELAQIKIFALKVLQPGGAAIIFPKSGQNQNSMPL